MIENGTQADSRDTAELEGDKVDGLTLLMLAACGKDCDVNMTEDDQISLVKYLLSKGADVNAYVPWGESVLTYAVGQGSREKTEEETKGGASRLPIVKLLLEHGAKTNVGAAYEHIMGGNTSLTQAAIHGYYQVVSLLFQYGAREGVYQAYKFAKENNHNQTAKLIQDKFWNNYKSDCLTNSGFMKSVMIGEPVDTENYAISIVQGKRSTPDSYINTAICILDKQNEKMEIAEPSAFKKFPFALAALSQSKELQQKNQTSFCNEARQLLSRESDLPVNNKSVDCIFNSKFISTIVIGEPTDTESYKIFITQGAHSVTDNNISTAICIFNKNIDAIDLIEPNIFKTYPFALSTFNTTNNNLAQLANDQLTCNDEIKQLLNGYIKDDKLTRGKAKRLIDEYFAKANNGEDVTIGIRNLRVYGCNRQSPPYRGMSDLDACYQITAQKGYGSSYNSVKAAAEHGFLVVSVVGYEKNNSGCENDLICNTLVEKTGQPFFWRSQPGFFGDIGTINTGRHKVVEILGIFKDSENVARIPFTFKTEPTDIGVLDSRTGIFSTDLKKRYAELLRYDDGWRVDYVCCIGL